MMPRAFESSQQVAQLLLDVAVVDVEGGHPGLVGAQHAFQVLVAVVEVEPQVVLARLVPGQARALGVGPQTVAVEERRQAPGPLGDVSVGVAPVAPDDAFAIRDGGGHRLVDLAQVEFLPAHRPPLFCRCADL